MACPAVRATDLSHPDPTGLLRAAGAAVHELAMSRRLDPSTLAAVVRLRRLVVELKPDVVHAHASIAGVVARLAVGRRAPVVWTPHAVSNRAWVRWVERSVRPRPDVVVALSDSEASVLRDAGLARGSRLELLPNGVEPRSSPGAAVARADLGIPPGVPVVGFIGRMQRQKAPVDFVEVAARVLARRPEAHVLCVGSGVLLADVLSRAAQVLPSQQFHHLVQDADAEPLLRLLDVLVVPSLYEGGPYLPLEAMLAGVPVVATQAMGLRDYVLDGISGLTAEVGDLDGLADHVVALLADAGMRSALVESASEHVERVHSLNAMAAGYERLYAATGQEFAGGSL